MTTVLICDDHRMIREGLRRSVQGLPGVDRVDTAGLQLLAAFVRDLRAEARTVEWVGCSDALNKAAQALGLHAALCLPGTVDQGSGKN